MRYLFNLLLIYFIPLYGVTLKEKFTQALPGDYIVTSQSKNCSILFIRSLSENSLTLEEISFPEKAYDLKEIKKWVAKGAPGHTSWVAYEIDLQDNSLKNSYSFDQRGWLYTQDGEYFLAKLLALPLNRKPQGQRKRIGPPPLNGEADQRAVWNPPLIRDGKKISKPKFDVWSGKWPKDDTQLSGCEIEFYFIQSFALPYWIEIKSPHYTLKIRTVDSGEGLTSPFRLIPQKPPLAKNGEALAPPL